ncbi:uncharacterized [Tachysurus ichikawai]
MERSASLDIEALKVRVCVYFRDDDDDDDDDDEWLMADSRIDARVGRILIVRVAALPRTGAVRIIVDDDADDDDESHKAHKCARIICTRDRMSVL